MKISRNVLLQLFSHHTLALIRWDVHFIMIRVANAILFKKNRLNKKLCNLDLPLYLNLGSGPRGLQDENWINVDGYKDTNVDYSMDFNRSFPFPDNTFDGIFCEHVFEHFTLENGQKMLHECYRVLQPGGCIRIIVPDGKKIMKTYFENPTELLNRREVNSSCAMESVNSYFRQRYEHQIAYDDELLKYQLLNSGFVNVFTSSFKQGKVSSAILLDDEKYEWESLYFEATKQD